MPKPAKLKDKEIQAWLDYLDDCLSTLSAQISTLAAADNSAIVDQVAANTKALAAAKADLDRFLKTAALSIDSIDLIAELVKALLEGDRTSAIERVRSWPQR